MEFGEQFVKVERFKNNSKLFNLQFVHKNQ